MSRLVLVSNRLPVTFDGPDDGPSVRKSVGGLATALREPHERTGGVWVGWPGTAGTPEPSAAAELERRLDALGMVPVHLSPQEVSRYYGAFSNGVLWPVFHYLAGVAPLRVEGWREYVEVNRRFADAVAARHRPGDLVWVHDYQLLLVPRMLRERLPDARIGFFLHIPFPSPELFATLPNRSRLLEGLLGADLIGFHTDTYRRHFGQALETVLDVHCPGDRAEVEGRSVRLGAFPIGIDARAFAERAGAPDVAEAAERLRGDGSHRLLLGIDRLDYTKGIPRRLLAFEELLRRWPEWRERVRLVQVAVPSRGGVRAYRRFRHEVDTLVGRINGEFATPHWSPVHYLYRSIDDAEISALYRAADVMLVTPVRDGMNLVAKEFAASRVDEAGVLVLSEFAGAAAQLGDAVLVNPYDVERTAEHYHQALTMGAEEARRRMRGLREAVFGYDVHRWVREFLGALRSAGAAEAAP